ncbi:MAG TPA: FKBP-type peptidyl-prolyl cis-trans isomerase [Elusimicrobiales bacterium]|nr:FKBP-type peptidyl-prolyl cis-trans isomerase [Elusimicrobiales bacterium]
MKLHKIYLLPILAAALLPVGCGNSLKVSDATVQLITYELKVDGKVVEKQETPKMLLPGIFPIKGVYEAIKGRTEGSKVTVIIPPEKAYGPYNKELITERLIDDKNPPKVGERIKTLPFDRQHTEGTVMEVQRNVARVDFNHPYAGKTLEYAIKIVRVVAKKAQ